MPAERRAGSALADFARSIFDVRAWIGLLRLVHHYNYTHVRERRALVLGDAVRLSPTVSLAKAERIRIGDRSHVGDRCSLWAGPHRSEITIGRDTQLAPEVFVTAADYGMEPGRPMLEQPMSEASIAIGDDVWIGTGVVIVAGVTIGDGAVVGAGSVVTRSIPPGAIAAGIPARVVRMRDGSAVPAHVASSRTVRTHASGPPPAS